MPLFSSLPFISFLLSNNQIITMVSKLTTCCAALTLRGLAALLPLQFIS